MSNLFVLTGRGSWTSWTIQAAANMDPVPFQVHHVTGAGLDGDIRLFLMVKSPVFNDFCKC